MATKKAIQKRGTKGRANSKDDSDKKFRADWEMNNELISEAFFNYVLRQKKFPTYAQIAKAVNLNEKTVRRHFTETDMFQDMKSKLNALKNKALMTLAMKAIKGESHHWSRLFFEVTDEVKKPNETGTTIIIQGNRPNVRSNNKD